MGRNEKCRKVISLTSEQAGMSLRKPIEKSLQDSRKEEPTKATQYDLSFAYSFQWEKPEKQIKEALKVLLCNPSDKNSNNLAQTKTLAKPSNTQAALEAAKIRWLLAINPNTPPPVLEHLTINGNVGLLERIAENPRTHSTTLAKLATHQDPQVRAAVAENMNSSIKTIWKLARDENADVRLRLAESYTIPIAVLKVLAEDENPYVAHRAQKTIYRILREVSELRTA